MQRNTFIAKRFRELYLDGRWITNTNCKELIQSVNLEQATKQVADLNTIALLTFHLNYYLDGLLNVFRGGDLEIRDKYSFDMPPIRTEADWEQLRATFIANAEAFAGHIEQMPDEQFDAPFVDEKYGNYWRNIEGVIEHGFYHFGQMVIIRKMVMR